MKNWGVWLGGFVFVTECLAMASHTHTHTDYTEDLDYRALPVIVFACWLVQHLGRALINGPTHRH